MNQTEKQSISRLRLAGVAQADIARLLSLPKSTVGSYLLRNSIEPLIKEEKGHCIVCHKKFPDGTRHDRLTCSATCRHKLWRLKKLQTIKELPICPTCGKAFTPSRNQIYCSLACSSKSRVKAVKPNE